MTGLFKFDFYTRDWFTGTRGMSLKARAVYIDLLVLMYETGGPLPNDPKYLCQILGLRDRRQLDPLLKELVDIGKIIVDGETLFNSRAEREIDAHKSRIKRSSKGGNSKAKIDRNGTDGDDQKGTSGLSGGHQQGTRYPFKQASIKQKQPLNVCPSPSPLPSPLKNPPIAPPFDSDSAPENVVPIADNTPPDTGRKYVFEGVVIKLKQSDYDAWRKTYHAIPDFDAALRTIDGGFAADMRAGKNTKGWFNATPAKLNYQHQKRLPVKKPVSEMSYFERIEAGII